MATAWLQCMCNKLGPGTVKGRSFPEFIPELIHFELDRLIIELFLFYLNSFNVC